MTAGSTESSYEFTYGDSAASPVKFDTASDLFEVAFTITDYRSNLWTTRPILVKEMTAISMKELFESIPNHAVPEVTSTASNDDKKITLKFRQPIHGLVIRSTACTLDGCQPKLLGNPGVDDKMLYVALVAGDSEFEDDTCSNRGTCDQSTGLCVCESGYYGEACSKQTTVR